MSKFPKTPHEPRYLLGDEIIDISPSATDSNMDFLDSLKKALHEDYALDQIREALGEVLQTDIEAKKIKVILLDNKIPISISPETLDKILEMRINKNTENNLGFLLEKFGPGLEEIYFLKNQVTYLLNEMKGGAFLPKELHSLEQTSNQLLYKTENIMKRYHDKPLFYPHIKIDHSVFESYAEPIIGEYHKLIKECEEKLING